MENKIMVLGKKINNYKDYKKANQILYKSPIDSFIMNKNAQWSQSNFETQFSEYSKKGYSLFEITYKDPPTFFSKHQDEKIKKLVDNYCQQYFQGKQDIDKFLKDLKSVLKNNVNT